MALNAAAVDRVSSVQLSVTSTSDVSASVDAPALELKVTDGLAASDTPGAFDGWVAAKGDKPGTVITSANQTFVPKLPPLANRINIMRDGRFGLHEFSRWPQSYKPSLMHLALIPRGPLPEGPSAVMWQPIGETDWTQDLGCGVVGMGFLRPELLDELAEEAARILARFDSAGLDYPKHRDAGTSLALIIRHLLDRIRLLPSTWEDTLIIATHIQRLVLEMAGLIKWLNDGVNRYFDPTFTAKVTMDVLGTFTDSPSAAQHFFRIGVPFWLVQPLTLRTRIFHVVDVVSPDFSVQPGTFQIVPNNRDVARMLMFPGDWQPMVRTRMIEAHCHMRLRPLTDSPEQGRIKRQRVAVPEVPSPSPPPSSSSQCKPKIRKAHHPAKTKAASANNEVNGSLQGVQLHPGRVMLPSPIVTYPAAFRSALRKSAPILGDPPFAVEYYFPPPFLLDVPYAERELKLGRYVHNMVRVRSFCRVRLLEPSIGGQPLTISEWRDVLWGEYTDMEITLRSKAGVQQRRLRRDSIRRLFGTGGGIPTHSPDIVATLGQYKITEATALDNPAVRRQLIWESHETNWRCELYALDSALLGTYEWDDLVRCQRDALIAKVWGACSGLSLAPHWEKETPAFCWKSVQDVGWEDSREPLCAFLTVLSRWPGFPEQLKGDPQRVLNCGIGTFEVIQKDAVAFYVLSGQAQKGFIDAGRQLGASPHAMGTTKWRAEELVFLVEQRVSAETRDLLNTGERGALRRACEHIADLYMKKFGQAFPAETKEEHALRKAHATTRQRRNLPPQYHEETKQECEERLSGIIDRIVTWMKHQNRKDEKRKQKAATAPVSFAPGISLPSSPKPRKITARSLFKKDHPDKPAAQTIEVDGVLKADIGQWQKDVKVAFNNLPEGVQESLEKQAALLNAASSRQDSTLSEEATRAQNASILPQHVTQMAKAWHRATGYLGLCLIGGVDERGVIAAHSIPIGQTANGHTFEECFAQDIGWSVDRLRTRLYTYLQDVFDPKRELPSGPDDVLSGGGASDRPATPEPVADLEFVAASKHHESIDQDRSRELSPLPSESEGSWISYSTSSQLRAQTPNADQIEREAGGEGEAAGVDDDGLPAEVPVINFVECNAVQATDDAVLPTSDAVAQPAASDAISQPTCTISEHHIEPLATTEHTPLPVPETPAASDVIFQPASAISHLPSSDPAPRTAGGSSGSAKNRASAKGSRGVSKKKSKKKRSQAPLMTDTSAKPSAMPPAKLSVKPSATSKADEVRPRAKPLQVPDGFVARQSGRERSATSRSLWQETKGKSVRKAKTTTKTAMKRKRSGGSWMRSWIMRKRTQLIATVRRIWMVANIPKSCDYARYRLSEVWNAAILQREKDGQSGCCDGQGDINVDERCFSVSSSRSAGPSWKKAKKPRYSQDLRALCLEGADSRKPMALQACPKCSITANLEPRMTYAHPNSGRWHIMCYNCKYFSIPTQSPIPPEQEAAIEVQRTADAKKQAEEDERKKQCSAEREAVAAAEQEGREKERCNDLSPCEGRKKRQGEDITLKPPSKRRAGSRNTQDRLGKDKSFPLGRVLVPATPEKPATSSSQEEVVFATPGNLATSPSPQIVAPPATPIASAGTTSKLVLSLEELLNDEAWWSDGAAKSVAADAKKATDAKKGTAGNVGMDGGPSSECPEVRSLLNKFHSVKPFVPRPFPMATPTPPPPSQPATAPLIPPSSRKIRAATPDDVISISDSDSAVSSIHVRDYDGKVIEILSDDSSRIPTGPGGRKVVDICSDVDLSDLSSMDNAVFATDGWSMEANVGDQIGKAHAESAGGSEELLKPVEAEDELIAQSKPGGFVVHVVMWWKEHCHPIFGSIVAQEQPGQRTMVTVSEIPRFVQVIMAGALTSWVDIECLGLELWMFETVQAYNERKPLPDEVVVPGTTRFQLWKGKAKAV
ncbi:hypothetical protein A0H81_12297 [Grifola frondosa]|uniref:Uncharacterized protein n=1 Tax=Grifola frondosa TaxID=5627 RepID=A0A1C7LU72_GRIFR|nr:hypothetical protein A0H81_12297 [Grifola frondosa]